MAKRNRYKEMEEMMTRALIGDAVVFALYLLFAARSIIILKVITAIVAGVGSVLCLGFLFMTGEIKKLRSRWMVTGFGAILLCLIVSLILNVPR